MKYIYAIKGAIILFIILIPATLLLPTNLSFGSDDVEVKTVLTISTFLFSILAGFFIGRLNNRYNKFLELSSNEDAVFRSIYNTSKFFKEDLKDKVVDLIDKYYIICYDFPLDKQYANNDKYFQEFYKILKDDKFEKEDFLDDMVSSLDEIEEYRGKTLTLGKDRLTKGQWGILIILVAIIISSIFYIRTDSLYSHIVTVLFSVSLITVLLIMRDLQNLMLGGKPLSAEESQINFERIGKLRYYNQADVDSGIMTIPDHIKKYRVGLHNPGEEFNIKVVERE